MRKTTEYIRQWLPPVVVMLLCSVLLLGGTIAHYEKRSSGTISMTYPAAGQVRLCGKEGAGSPLGGWQIEENLHTLDFLLTNGDPEGHCTYDQRVTLRVRATVGLDYAGSCIVTLRDTTTDTEYTAVAEEIAEGTTQYAMYGPGWVFRFYDASGAELTWLLPGDSLQTRGMRLTVNGTAAEPALLQLIADTVPA